jgi:hypothetical protein
MPIEENLAGIFPPSDPFLKAVVSDIRSTDTFRVDVPVDLAIYMQNTLIELWIDDAYIGGLHSSPVERRKYVGRLLDLHRQLSLALDYPDEIAAMQKYVEQMEADIDIYYPTGENEPAITLNVGDKFTCSLSWGGDSVPLEIMVIGLEQGVANSQVVFRVEKAGIEQPTEERSMETNDFLALLRLNRARRMTVWKNRLDD